MNNPDTDKRIMKKDNYGNLLVNVIKHKGFTIDICIGYVKLWDTSDNFCGEYPDVKSAKSEIENVLLAV
jgi:hypothetical protein